MDRLPRASRLVPLLIAAGLGLFAGCPAPAQDGDIGIELNRLQQAETVCRLIFLFTNRLPVQVDSLEVETVLFAPDGRADRFLLLKSQPLPPGKIRVHQYDLAGTECAAIGSVLINDVVACRGEGLTPTICMDQLAASSREKAALFTSISDRRPGAAQEQDPSGPAPAQ